VTEPRDPALDAFVELLRTAEPSPQTVATARARVLTAAQAPAPRGGASILIKLGLLSAALCLGSAPPPALAPLPAPPDHTLAVAAMTPPPLPSPMAEPAPAPVSAERLGPPRVAPPVAQSAEPELVLDVAPVPVMPSGPSAPSATMTEALMHVAAARCGDALAPLRSVAEGRTGDRRDRVQQAELLWARCLAQLGYAHAATRGYAQLTRVQDHPHHAAAVAELAPLVVRQPEPGAALEPLEAYVPPNREALADAHLLRWRLGSRRHRQGRLEEASALLAQVEGEHANEARYLAGVIAARRGRAAEAIDAFDRVLDHTAEGERLHDLAWLGVARVYYALAMRAPHESRLRASRLQVALNAWSQIPTESASWTRAFAEETWALYLVGDSERALGHAHALTSPTLRSHADPEVELVRAMIQLEHCQWDSVERTVGRFRRRVEPRLEAADALLNGVVEPEAAFGLLVARRAGIERGPPILRASMRDALSGEALDRHLRQVRAIEAERRRLAGDARLQGDVAAALETELAIARSLAVDRAGEEVRARLRRMRDELADHASRMDTVDLEVATARREELARPNRAAMEPVEGGPITAQAGGQRWPWDGEWWPRELPHYRQAIRNRCR